MGMLKKTRQQRRAEKRVYAKQESSAARNASRRRAQAPSQSPIPQADKIDLIESFDTFAGLRNGLRKVADEIDEIAGVPMPLEGHRLIINPKFTRAEALSKIGAPEETEDDGARLVNSWWSRRHRCEVVIVEEADGKRWATRIPRRSEMEKAINTVSCSYAWGIEQEAKALNLLGTLIPHHMFKSYLLTGMIVETSKRSGITYIFRKLRPTIALSPRAGRDDRLTALCTLCLHPIAYYEGTWAGAMCPTDDVIAHLMLMRGDEPMFWRRANQHAPDRPESGLA